MSWDGVELLRTESGVGILRGGTGVELSLAEIRWIVRNVPIILKVNAGEGMRMPMLVPKPKEKKR